MFCQRIRDLREDQDLTQADIAKKLGLHTTQYARYERGDFNKIPFDFIISFHFFMPAPPFCKIIPSPKHFPARKVPHNISFVAVTFIFSVFT